MRYDHLLFRRQFLLTTSKCKDLISWQCESLGQLYLYAHPDLEFSVAARDDTQSKIALFGYMIDPNRPALSNFQILNDILHSIESIDNIPVYLHSIGGRFVLAMTTPKDAFIFHDACGLRTVYYTKHGGVTCIGSQPLLFEHVSPLKVAERFITYQESEYRRSKIEHWIPSDCSLYENIHHLMPNHYLRISDLEQKRYWPNRQLTKRGPDEVAYEAADLMARLMEAGNLRFKLAFPLTAGWDSRILLGACRNIAADIYFYTLQYRDLNSQSADIKIPKMLLDKLGCQHNVIDCRGAIDPEFAELYEKNTSMAHKEDWGRIAYGMLTSYPSDRVCIKGNCSEICRCFYYKSGKHPAIKSERQLARLEPGWSELPFVEDHLSSWLSEANVAADHAGINILDLFYWEHRMGSWQAQSQLEWDIVQEAYTPFNHRYLLEMMLCVPPKFRCAPDYSLYRRIGKCLWPEVMEHPINPPENSKQRVKHILTQFGFDSIVRNVRRRLSM